jgi:ACS family hexuronate transporter-like MFS transporter
MGFFWLIIWLLVYRKPSKHSWLSEREKEFINSDQPDISVNTVDAPKRTWKELLRLKQVWGIILARFFGDPVWWLYLIWLPSYLYDVRGYSIKDIGTYAWLPFLASGVGSLTGGWFSGYLIGKGKSVDFSRKLAIILPTFLMVSGVGAIYAPSAMLALTIMSVVLFGFQFWVNNVQTLASDYFSINEVGRVTGMAQTGAGLGAITFTMLIGWIVDHFSYSPVLVIGGILGPLATLSVLVLGGRIKRLQVKP